jgi:hypothetical protein
MATLALARIPPSTPNKKFIASRQPPPCKHCKYFSKGTCKLFFSQSPMSGELVYYDAETARLDKNLCGYDGRYFNLLNQD